LNYCWEYIFVFSSYGGKDLDRLGIGVEFSDKTNLKRGSRGKHGDLHCAGDIWFIPYETTGSSKKKAHVYEYPLELVQRCVELSSASVGIFDPFMGSGQTAIAGKAAGLDVYGSEINPLTYKELLERIK